MGRKKGQAVQLFAFIRPSTPPPVLILYTKKTSPGRPPSPPTATHPRPSRRRPPRRRSRPPSPRRASSTPTALARFPRRKSANAHCGSRGPATSCRGSAAEQTLLTLARIGFSNWRNSSPHATQPLVLPPAPVRHARTLGPRIIIILRASPSLVVTQLTMAWGGKRGCALGPYRENVSTIIISPVAVAMPWSSYRPLINRIQPLSRLLFAMSEANPITARTRNGVEKRVFRLHACRALGIFPDPDFSAGPATWNDHDHKTVVYTYCLRRPARSCACPLVVSIILSLVFSSISSPLPSNNQALGLARRHQRPLHQSSLVYSRRRSLSILWLMAMHYLLCT